MNARESVCIYQSIVIQKNTFHTEKSERVYSGSFTYSFLKDTDTEL